jgi:hypothetical protein
LRRFPLCLFSLIHSIINGIKKLGIRPYNGVKNSAGIEICVGWIKFAVILPYRETENVIRCLLESDELISPDHELKSKPEFALASHSNDLPILYSL